MHTGDGFIGGAGLRSGVSPVVVTAAALAMAARLGAVTATATPTATTRAASGVASPPNSEALLGTFAVVVLAALLLRRFA